MIEHGERAPAFELPAVVEGDIERVALEEALGRDVLVLVFYPGDFNPACSDDTTALDAFDSLGLQAGVTALAVSSDSVYSHRAFADAYDLRLPVLADVYGTVAEAYGVAVADERAGYRTRRAVVVVDHGGRVEYTWVADSPETLPDVEKLRDVVARLDGDGGDAVDDEELEEIASELESQTEAGAVGQAASGAVDDPSPPDDAGASDPDGDEWSALDDTDEGATRDDPDAANIEGTLDADDIELDLADPTESDGDATDADTDGTDEDRESDTDGSDAGTGDHGATEDSQ